MAPSRGGVQGKSLVNPYNIQVSYGSNAGAGWFGPLDPMRPSAPPEVAGRQWDYPSGYNLSATPRAAEPVSFVMLRSLADAYDVLRTVIETRKDQVARMHWMIRARSSSANAKPDERIEATTKFFRRPDSVLCWEDWIRVLLEDLYVIDAVSLYMRRTRSGKLVELCPLDGATITPVIDDWGRVPRDERAVAFQQNLHGLPAVNYSIRDLLYRPRNRRVNRAYGFSQVEQIVTTVNIALRKQLFNLNYYTEGSVPDALIGTPEDWTPDQIGSYQKYWDAYFEGDLARRRKAKFIPGKLSVQTTKEPDLKNEFDEWLARVVCFAFSISPQPFIKMMNRGSADTSRKMSEEEGLTPILDWLKAMIDDILELEFNAPDLEFYWESDEAADETAQFKIVSGYTGQGILTINEARAHLGKAPFEDKAANEPMVLTGAGLLPIGANTLEGKKQQIELETAAAAAALGEEGVADASEVPFDEEEIDDEAEVDPDDAAWTEEMYPLVASVEDLDGDDAEKKAGYRGALNFLFDEAKHPRGPGGKFRETPDAPKPGQKKRKPGKPKWTGSGKAKSAPKLDREKQAGFVKRAVAASPDHDVVLISVTKANRLLRIAKSKQFVHWRERAEGGPSAAKEFGKAISKVNGEVKFISARATAKGGKLEFDDSGQFHLAAARDSGLTVLPVSVAKGDKAALVALGIVRKTAPKTPSVKDKAPPHPVAETTPIFPQGKHAHGRLDPDAARAIAKKAFIQHISAKADFKYQSGELLEYAEKALKEGKMAGLSSYQIALLRWYTGPNYGGLNLALRQGTATPAQIDIRDGVNGALAAAHVKFTSSENVYRTITMNDSSLEPIMKQLREGLEAGKPVQFDAFASTSASKDFAYGWGKDLRFVMRVKSGVYIDSISSNKGEKEVLFPTWTRFKVVGIDKSKNPPVVTLAEVDDVAKASNSSLHAQMMDEMESAPELDLPDARRALWDAKVESGGFPMVVEDE